MLNFMKDILSLLHIPIENQNLLIVLGGFALAGYAIYAVISVVKDR